MNHPVSAEPTPHVDTLPLLLSTETMRSVLVVLALLAGCDAFSFGGLGRRITGTRKPGIGGRGFHSGFNGNFNGNFNGGGGGRIGASSVGDDSAEVILFRRERLNRFPLTPLYISSQPPKEPESDESKGLGLWDSYNKVLDEKPLATKAMTSLVGFLIGDVLAQASRASPLQMTHSLSLIVVHAPPSSSSISQTTSTSTAHSALRPSALWSTAPRATGSTACSTARSQAPVHSQWRPRCGRKPVVHERHVGRRPGSLIFCRPAAFLIGWH